jgi:uncharacterized protein (DUF1778 family)
MAEAQDFMFNAIFEHAMTMLKDQESFSHDQYDSFNHYMADSTAHWKRVRSLLEMCRQMAEEIDVANEELEELEDDDSESDNESVCSSDSIDGQNV